MDTDHTNIWNERWRLAALTREQVIKIALLSIIIGMVFALFHFQGNTTDPRLFGRSIFTWLTKRWRDTAGDYSHGWVIPLFSLMVLWIKRRDLVQAERSVDRMGLVVIVISMLIHWLGAKSQHPRASLFALILLTWGIPYYFFGWKVARILIFPCAYLLFCIPVTFLDALTFDLRIMVTKTTTSILNGLGVEVVRSGSIIRAADGSFVFNIDDPCSGLRSLLAMTAITALYAYFTQRTLLKKWILFCCSVPLAVAGNMIRILTIGLVAKAFGQEVATGLYHDYSGYIFFPVAIGLMIGAGALLNVDFKTGWTNWKAHYLTPRLENEVSTHGH